MEGERILKDLLKKNLDGLYDDTKNYIAVLTRVLEPEAKNGYKNKTSGCNTVEQIITKYSQFCNKFLRCAIEILKGAKDGKDLKDVMKIVDMVMGVLDLVLVYDNGKYQSLVPPLDDVGKKVYHITSQLISKGAFEISINYVEYCIKYVQLAKTTENSCIKELKTVAKSMGSLCWRAAILVEQSSKESNRNAVCVNAFKWRLYGVVLDAEAGSESISSVVAKATKSTMKFQMDYKGSNKTDFDTNLLYHFHLVFDMLKTHLKQNSKQLPDLFFDLFDFGLHFARVLHSIQGQEESTVVFEKLEGYTNETLKLFKANTTEHCSVSRFISCNIALTKGTLIMDQQLLRNTMKPSNLEKLERLLDEGYKVLELLLPSKGVTLHPALSRTLEHLKYTLQTILSKDKLLPNRIFQHVQLILATYSSIIYGEMRTLSSNVKHQQQYQKAVSKYLSLASLVIKIYLQRIQIDLKQKDSKERKQLMAHCLEYCQQCSNTINSLITNSTEVCSPEELMLHGSLTFTIGKELYRHDIFERAVDFMRLGCTDMKQWCLSDGNAFTDRIQQLLAKYEVLYDCQRRAKCYNETMVSITTILELLLYSTQGKELSSVESDWQKYLQLWVHSKHDIAKHCYQGDDVSVNQQRTILDVVNGSKQDLPISFKEASYLLQQELSCCKILSARYNTSMEQLSITAQLVNLHREENTCDLPAALLEHMKIIHSLGNSGQDGMRPLDYCQEAIDSLEVAIGDCPKDDDTLPLVTMQDTLATAYLWKGILQHEDIMVQLGNNAQGKELETDEETKETADQVISLEQQFVQSLHSAVDMWTSMLENCLKESKNGKIDLSQLMNPVDTVNSLKNIGLLYGILNQPLNQVHANHLCAVIGQALNTLDGSCEAIDSYCQAIHTLCNIHDLHHAQLVMSYCKKIEAETSLRPSSLVHLLLAKGHLYLELSQISEGEECLCAVMDNDFMKGKANCDQVAMQSMLYWLLARYLQLPPSRSTCPLLTQGGIAEGMTPLDAAVESVTKLESIVDKLFSHKSVNTSSAPLVSNGKNTLEMVQILLECQKQCGHILSYQGMVKQAIKYYTDGLHLARRLALPYRAAEFINCLSITKLHKGDYAAAKDHLILVCKVVSPVIHPSGDVATLEDCLQAGPSINHKDTCQCVCCTDPTIQSLQITFFIMMSKYLETMQEHRQSIIALGIADELISHATQRLQSALEQFTSLLRLGSSCLEDDGDSLKSDKTQSKKKGRGKSSKAKQAKKPVITQDNENISLSSTTQMMFSCYLCQVFAQNAEILLENNKLSKAVEVLKGGNDVVQTIRKVTESIPYWLIPDTTCLLYLEGVAHILQALQNNKISLDSSWGIASDREDTKTVNDQPKMENTSKTKKRSARGQSRAKDVSMVSNDNDIDDKEKTVKKKGKGRGKKAAAAEIQGKLREEESKECSRSKQAHGKECLCPAIESFTKALELCSHWPNPQVFSQLCQCLSLCHGQCDSSKTVNYLDVSLGVTLRYEAAYSSRKKIRKLLKQNKSEESLVDVSSLSNKLNSMTIDEYSGDHPSTMQSLQEMRNLMVFKQNTVLDISNIPKEWTICTLIPVKLPATNGNLVISRQRPGTKPVLVKVPLPDTESEDDVESSISVNKAVVDLSRLFQGNIQQEFADIMQSSTESMNINDSKDWHHARSKLDSQLKCLCERMENSWLGMWKGIVLGQHCDLKQQEALQQAIKELTPQLNQYAMKSIDEQLLEIIVDSHGFLTTQQVKESLATITGIDKQSCVLDKVLEKFKEATSYLTLKDSAKKKEEVTTNDRHPVILILGKDIQHLPWESIPILRHYPVTRMPCMHLILAQTQKDHSNVIDPVNAYFVLNPEGNLPNTQKIFQKWFESELKWEGLTGQKPSEDQYKAALSDHDLFLYLGHGTGQSFLRGDDVQRVICKATTLLMGCSSAKLTVGGVCEPRGMSLSYLVAGCPAIVGNLWDVTDRDIDRFTKSLLQAWLQHGQMLSLPQFIRNARQVCKWPYLIGASPVLYGVPVFLKN